MTLSVAATDRLVAALTYIHNHPEEWDQSDWVYFIKDGRAFYGNIPERAAATCDTAACVAGRIALQSGASNVVDNGYVVPARFVDSNGHALHAATLATQLLLDGSDDPKYDAELIDQLFNADNDEGDLWHYARRLAAYPLQVPDGVNA